MALDVVPVCIALCVGTFLMATLRRLFRSRGPKHVLLPPDIFHPLDSMAKCFLRMQDTGNSPTSCALILESKQQVTLRDVEKAAKHLMERHLLLRSRIHKPDADSSEAYYADMGSDAVESFIVAQIQRDDWQTVLEKAFLQRFDCEAGPLWSLAFIPNVMYTATGPKLKDRTDSGQQPYSDHDLTATSPEERSSESALNSILLFSFHHCMTDGTYRTRLLVEMLEILDHVLQGTEVPLKPSGSPCNLTDHLTELTWREAILFRFMSVMRPFMPVLFRLAFSKNTFIARMGSNTSCQATANSTHLIPLEWSKEFTKIVLKSCKQHGCTVHGALHVACGVALARLMRQDEATFKTEVAVGTPVNLRPHVEDIPDDAAGVCMGLVQSNAVFSSSEVAMGDYWKQAVACSRDIHSKIQCGDAFWLPRLGLGPPELANIMMELMEATRSNESTLGRFSTGVNITNMGRSVGFDIPRQMVKPLALFWGTPEHKCGPIFSLKICTFNERAFCTFAYYEKITSRSSAERYVEYFHDVLEEMVSE